MLRKQPKLSRHACASRVAAPSEARQCPVYNKCEQLRRTQAAQDRFKNQLCFESLLRGTVEPAHGQTAANWVPAQGRGPVYKNWESPVSHDLQADFS